MSAAEILKKRMDDLAEKKERRESAAKRNRETMPGTAALVDECRRIFGNGIKLKWSIENGRTIGKVPYDLVKDGL